MCYVSMGIIGLLTDKSVDVPNLGAMLASEAGTDRTGGGGLLLALIKQNLNMGK